MKPLSLLLLLSASAFACLDVAPNWDGKYFVVTDSVTSLNDEVLRYIHVHPPVFEKTNVYKDKCFRFIETMRDLNRDEYAVVHVDMYEDKRGIGYVLMSSGTVADRCPAPKVMTDELRTNGGCGGN